MSKTPITEQSMFEVRHHDQYMYVVRVEVAERLERKLNELRAQMEAVPQ